MRTRPLPALLALFVTGVAVLLTMTGCTEKTADAKRAPKRGALPMVLVELPGEPSAVAYLRSPSTLATQWVDRIKVKMGGTDGLPSYLSSALQGPASAGALSGFDGTTVIGLYERPELAPAALVRVKGGRADKLDRWVTHLLPGGVAGTQQIGDNEFSQIEFQGEMWFYGEEGGDWIFSNDTDLLEKPKQKKRNMLLPVLEECWKSALTQDKTPEVFVAAELPRLSKEEKKGPTGQMMKMLGVDRADFVVYLLEERQNRYIDSVFLHTPAPHRGLLSLADGKTVSEDVIAAIAEESISFGYLPLDLSKLWEDLNHLIPPMQRGAVNQMEKQLELRFKKDLLDAFGTGWVWNRFSHSLSPNGVATVARIPVVDDYKLKQCLQKIAAANKVELKWKVGPDDYKLLTVPIAGQELSFAAHKDHWYFAPSEAAMRVWLSNVIHRGGHTAPRDLFQRYSKKATWLAWVGEAALKADAATEFDLSALRRMPGMNAHAQALFDLPIGDWQRQAPGLFGDLVMAVVPAPKGISAQFESDCGLFPWTFVGMTVWSELQEQERERRKLQNVCQEIAVAQELFREAEGRFANSLWELGDAGVIDAKTANGIRHGHLFRLISDGARWQVEFKCEADDQVFMMSTTR